MTRLKVVSLQDAIQTLLKCLDDSTDLKEVYEQLPGTEFPGEEFVEPPFVVYKEGGLQHFT